MTANNRVVVVVVKIGVSTTLRHNINVCLSPLINEKKTKEIKENNKKWLKGKETGLFSFIIFFEQQSFHLWVISENVSFRNSWSEQYVHVCSEDTCVFLSYVSWPWLCGLREPPADVQIQHFISIWIISAAGLWVWLELNTERNLEMLLPVWDRRVTTCWHRVNNPHTAIMR